MSERHPPIRVISATRKANGAAVFNQAVMVQDPPPKGLLLVAIDPAFGLKLWMRPFRLVEPHTGSQAAGYSRNLRIKVDEPPEWLGPPVEIPDADVDESRQGLWSEIRAARTNTMNKLIRELFGFA